MSAATVTPAIAPHPRFGSAQPARRRHLRVVPPLPQQEARPAAFRLTRRGRRALALAVVVLAILVGAAISATAGGVEAQQVVTVSSGETLSDLARAHLPGVPVGTAVAQIQVANGLNSRQVSSGQQLVIPAP